MEKEKGKTVLLPIILIPVAGLVLLGMCFIMYISF